jgi:hypothetical protein
LLHQEAERRRTLHEAARIVTELFDELDLDSADDEALNALAHRIVEIIAGLTLAGYGATSYAANVAGVDRLEVLREVEASIREEDEPGP